MLYIRTVNYRFYSSKIIAYKKVLYAENVKTWQRNTKSMQHEKKYTGEVTAPVKNKINRILTAWLTALEVHESHLNDTGHTPRRRAVFVTLTIPDETKMDDKVLKKKLLKEFIRQIRKETNVKNFLWKAETTKKGQLHFHIIFDYYLEMSYIRKKWNKILNNNNLVENYKRKHNTINAPSTHVRGIDNAAAAAGYLFAEMTKKRNRRKIDGKVYDNSVELSKLKPYEYDILEDYNEGFEKSITKTLKKETINEYCAIIKLKKDTTINDFPGEVQRNYFKHYEQIYRQLYETTGKQTKQTETTENRPEIDRETNKIEQLQIHFSRRKASLSAPDAGLQS